ncbi:hypothetical protein PybrP1_000988 [[Pythium] brassicae (nom. inval.)]|nr:hypothetical protein PybrP1_000988 [[Pythium] brassicae (nom. inval.)]
MESVFEEYRYAAQDRITLGTDNRGTIRQRFSMSYPTSLMTLVTIHSKRSARPPSIQASIPTQRNTQAASLSLKDKCSR